ncbi:GntR family transcriptional regulator [Tsukamurella sp. 1534]|uniref:GntR family transcriptional regulator n=1 Tax=Tsukamurella sp. 1534 TaxID=1151061 RepID=UPI000592A3D6|nr:GntR family transcriptional regulator [Tsukamurella sp. 1534]
METARGGAATHVPVAEAVAARVRDRIFDGVLPPGIQLYEEQLAEELGASRNTLREAFRLLSHERLVQHVRHRGVFVRTPTADDARDLWRAREVLECGALAAARRAATPPAAGVDLEDLTVRATAAAERGEWAQVGTYNGEVHLAICGLAGSARLVEEARRLLTEIRLVFVAVGGAQVVHEPWLRANAELARLISAGDLTAAEDALRDYLHRSGESMVALFHARDAAAR